MVQEEMALMFGRVWEAPWVTASKPTQDPLPKTQLRFNGAHGAVSEILATGNAAQAVSSVVTASGDPIAEVFQGLVDDWRRECALVSSASRRTQHPAYRTIVGMGRTVLPYLLGEMLARPNEWSAALIEISGENPVRASDRGDLTKVARAWAAWAKRRQIVPR